MVGGIIPGKVNACNFFALPVNAHGVVFFEDAEEVVGMLFAHVLNAKVINDEEKLDKAPCVVPEARRGGGFVVACGIEALPQQVICRLA